MKLVVSFVAVVIAAAAPQLAHAAPRFELLCGTMKDGQAVDVLPSAKKPKLTGPIGCALRVHHPDPDQPMLVTLQTTRYLVDGGKKTKVQPRAIEGKQNPDDDGSMDYEWMISPDDRDADGVVYFASCEDFDIHVGIDVPSGATIFQKTIKIAQACPKPKPITAKVTCTATQQGESWSIPTKKPFRLSDGTVACVVAPKDKRDKIGDLTVSGWIEHPDQNDTSKQVESTHKDADVDPVGEGTWVQYDLTFDNNDYAECFPGTIVLQAKDGDGNVRFTKRVKLDQDCED